MDNNDQPEIESATQIVDFGNTDEIAQPQQVPGSVSLDPQEQAAQLPPVDPQTLLRAPEIADKGEISREHNSQVDPQVSTNGQELENNGESSAHRIEQVNFQTPVTTGPQAIEGKSAAHGPQDIPGAPGFASAALSSEKETPPDELSIGYKGKGVERAVPRIITVNPGEDVGYVPSPIEAVAIDPAFLLNTERRIIPSPPHSILEVPAPVLRKRRNTRKPAGLLEFFIGGGVPRRTTNDSRKTASKTSDRKNDPKLQSQRTGTLKEDEKQVQTKDDLKEPALAEKAFGKPQRTDTAETKKLPPSDPWDTCDLEIRTSDDPNGMNIDIVAIHDLDETKGTAWTWVADPLTQKNLKNLKDNDTESKRSRASLEERIRIGLQANKTIPDGSKRRRGSTKDESTLPFVEGKITTKGRIQRAGEYVSTISQHDPLEQDPSEADPASAKIDTANTGHTEPDHAKTDSLEAQHPRAEPEKTEPLGADLVLAKSDPLETQQLGTGPTKSDSAKTGLLKTGHTKTDDSVEPVETVKTDLLEIDHVKTDSLETQQPGTAPGKVDSTETGLSEADEAKNDDPAKSVEAARPNISEFEQPKTDDAKEPVETAKSSISETDQAKTSDSPKPIETANTSISETDHMKTGPLETQQLWTEPAKGGLAKTAPLKDAPAAPGKLSSHTGSTNGLSHQDGPGETEINMAGPSTSRPETKAISSNEAKKENVRPELKRAKSSSKKRTSRILSSNVLSSGDHPPPVPELPETTPPKPEQNGVDAGDGGGAGKETEESRASERDQRSGRQSAEVDSRRSVHLFHEPTMIPAAFPGARILSYTYPKLAPATAHEYVSKAATKLLDSLISARSTVNNTAPIIFIGYGFGGMILQKLLILAADAPDAPDEKKAASTQLLEMTAGFVFLNTPFPAHKSEDNIDKPIFPPVINARQAHIIRRLGEDGNKVDIRNLWEKFDVKRTIGGQKLPIIWFHTLLAKDASSAAKMQPKRPLPELAQHAIFCMAMASDTSKRALSRFSSSKDPLYQRLVDQLRRCLLFRASQRKELLEILKALVAVTDINVDVEDEHGRSALHCAASSSNHEAVTVLVKRGEANVGHRDLKGQTPLHVAIQRAAELNPPEKEAQKPFRVIIERLIEKAQDIFLTDKWMRNPWYYANDLKWIKELKDNRDMHLGPTTSIGVHSLETVTPPSTEAQLMVCDNIRADLVEFYTITKEQKTEERRNQERSYVLDMIYNSCPREILELARPRLKDKQIRQCRWLHLPANNEQWAHDLFISLRIKDSSFVGQHDGSGHNLHMIAQATKYTQICEPGYWDTKSHERKSSLEIESPDTARKTTDPIPKTIERDAIVIFMPILAYEPSVLRKKMSKNVRRLLRHKKIEEEDNRDMLLLQAYVGDPAVKPLHCRRTLDQFSYYMLDSTESRDMDQVLLRWGRKRLEKVGNVDDAPVLMVDQLWLWVLHDGTVITSFPNAWEWEGKDPDQPKKIPSQPHGLKRRLDEEIKFNKQRPAIESVDHLVHLIMRLSVDILRRDAPGGIKFQDAFQSSINNIAEREAKQFKYFKTLTKKLSMKTPTEAQRIFLNGKLDSEKLSEAQKRALRKKLNTRELTEAQRTENIEKLFELNLETHLLVEIKDIQDELNIVSSILGQQKDVLRRLYKLCFVNDGAEGDSSTSRELKATRDSSVESSADIQGDSGDKPKHKGILHHDDESDASSIHERKKEKQVHVHWEDAKTKEKDTPLLKKRGLVEDNFAIVMSNIRIIEDMQHYAETVHTSISNLLDLKQRQANAWEARFSREGSQQSQRQGNIMLVFTLVTIVFLPLSFMSSFFALGVNSFPKDAQSGNVSWPLHTLALLLFGISTLVFVPLVFIALYVNQITSFTRETFQAFFLPSNPVIDDIEEKKVEEDDESDEEEFKDDGDESTKVAEDDEGHVEVISEALSEDTTETYARLFGRWNFHTKIPGIRELWRWQVYLNNADDHDSEYLDDEFENYNYPLQHFLDKIPFEKVFPTFIHRWRSPRDDDISSTYYADSYDDSNATRDRRRSRRVSTIVVEEVRRRRGSDDDEVVVIEEYSPGPRNRVRRRGARPVPRITRLFGRRKEKAGSDDEDEEVEDGSDLPQSRASRLLGAVDLVARMFGRRIVDDDDDSAITYDDSDDSRPQRPPIPRAASPVVRRRSNSDDEIVVIEERSPVRRLGRPVGRSNRRPGRRRSDSDDEVVVIEERRPPSSRVRRASRPVGRTARRSGRRNLDSDDEVVVVEEDESDIPQSRAGRVFRSVAWMFRGRGRETEDEYSDEAASYDEEEDELPRSLASRVLAPVEWFFQRRGRETEEGEYSDETRSSDHGEVVEVEEEEEEEGEEGEEELPRSLVSRVLGPVGRIFRRRGAETDEEGEYSDETRPSREEASAASGSDGPASAHRGLGAALPEPLKRLFLRRRRVHDVESVLEDD